MEPSRPGGALLALCVACMAAQASAQPSSCPEPVTPGPVETTPASGAGGVTLDAPVRVLYTPGYFAEGGPSNGTETVVVTDPDGFDVPGEVQRAGDAALFFVPNGLLDPSTRYEVVAIGSSGTLEASFVTGTTVDVEPPALGRITRIAVDPIGPSCSAPAGGHRVGISFAPATDDGALGSIEYSVYLTRGPGVDAPVRVARQRHYAGDEITAAFVLDDEQVDSIVCVALRAEDGVGRVGEGEDVCFDPITGAFFAPLCSTRAVGAGGAPALALVLLVGALVLGVRLRGRRARASRASSAEAAPRSRRASP